MNYLITIHTSDGRHHIGRTENYEEVVHVMAAVSASEPEFSFIRLTDHTRPTIAQRVRIAAIVSIVAEERP
jgi:hypothetical protein